MAYVISIKKRITADNKPDALKKFWEFMRPIVKRGDERYFRTVNMAPAYEVCTHKVIKNDTIIKPRAYYYTSIPDRFMDEMGWQSGDFVCCRKKKDQIITTRLNV